jgi:hypothetical protein
LVPPVFVIGNNAGGIYTSDTATNGSWVNQGAQLSSVVMTVKWISELKIFVAVGYSGELFTSPDAVNWTSRTSGFSTSIIHDIAYSSSLGMLVAVGAGGKVGRSTDGGVTWTTSIAIPNAYNQFALDWSPTLGVFASSGQFGAIYTSSDGITWTSRYNTGNSQNGMVWIPELSKFVTAGSSGSWYTSNNGTSWTNTYNSANVYAVTWSPSLSRILGVGLDGYCIYTPDATSGTFSSGGTIMGGVTGYSVAWSAAAGKFIAVGASGKIATSPTGISGTWTTLSAVYVITESGAVCASR